MSQTILRVRVGLNTFRLWLQTISTEYTCCVLQCAPNLMPKQTYTHAVCQSIAFFFFCYVQTSSQLTWWLGVCFFFLAFNAGTQRRWVSFLQIPGLTLKKQMIFFSGRNACYAYCSQEHDSMIKNDVSCARFLFFYF